MGQILNDLNFNLFAFLVNIIAFVFLFLVLKKFLFGPVGDLLDARRKDIDSTYDQIEADRARMETTREDYQARLAKIEEERRDTVQRAINEAQQTRDQIIHEASTRAQEMISRAEREVAYEREQALVTLRREVVDLALGAATRVIGDNLDETRQRRLIDDFIATGGTALNAPPVGDGATPALATAGAVVDASAAAPARSRSRAAKPAATTEPGSEA